MNRPGGRSLACALWAAAAWAQAPPGAPSIRVTVSLVQVDATVTGRSGEPVTDLTADDFEILQDGRPRKITQFSYVRAAHAVSRSASAPLAPVPAPGPATREGRTIAVVVDDLGLSWESMLRTRDALRRFVTTQLQPGDVAAIIRTSRGSGALQTFTTDRALLLAAADSLQWSIGRSGVNPLDSANSLPESDPEMIEFIARAERERERGFAAGSANALRWILRGLAGMPGRKSVVLFSEGMPAAGPDSRAPDPMGGLLPAIDEAARSAAVIYTIDPRGLAGSGETAADRTNGLVDVSGGRARLLRDTQASLRALAEQTGGLTFLNDNDLDAGIRRALQDQAGYYLLGYDPGEATFDRRFHRIEVRTRRSGLTVRSRRGFFGVDDRTPLEAAAKDDLERAVYSPFFSGAIPLKLTALFGIDQAKPAVIALLHIDGAGVGFQPSGDGWHHASFDLLVAQIGEDGGAAHHRESFQIRARAEERAHAEANGLVYRARLNAPSAGASHLRLAIRDASGRIGSAAQFLPIPDLSSRRLAVGGIMLHPAPSGSAHPAMANPATRVFPRGSAIAYECQVLNASGATSVRVRMRTGGRTVFESPWRDIAQGGAAHLEVKGELKLSSAMPPGDYALDILARGSTGKRSFAAQSIDLRVTEEQ